MEFQIFTPKPIKIEIAFGRGRGYWLGNQQRSAAFALIDPAVGSHPGFAARRNSGSSPPITH